MCSWVEEDVVCFGVWVLVEWVCVVIEDSKLTGMGMMTVEPAKV